MKTTGWLVASDVDATALIASRGIPPRNIEAVRRFTGAGGLFTFASGRSLAMLRDACGAFAVNAPVIALNGSLICSMDTGEVFSSHPLPDSARAMAAEVRDRFEGRCGVMAVGRATYHAISRDARSRAIGMRNTASSPVVTPLEAVDEPLYKVIALTDTVADTFAARDWLLRRFGGEYAVVCSGDHIVEVMDPRVNKGSALLELADLLGVARDHVAAIGDNENDLEMLAAAAFSAAPGDAIEAAKRAAGRAVGDCMDGALADLIDLLMEG